MRRTWLLELALALSLIAAFSLQCRLRSPSSHLEQIESQSNRSVPRIWQGRVFFRAHDSKLVVVEGTRFLVMTPTLESTWRVVMEGAMDHESLSFDGERYLVESGVGGGRVVFLGYRSCQYRCHSLESEAEISLLQLRTRELVRLRGVAPDKRTRALAAVDSQIAVARRYIRAQDARLRAAEARRLSFIETVHPAYLQRGDRCVELADALDTGLQLKASGAWPAFRDSTFPIFGSPSDAGFGATR